MEVAMASLRVRVDLLSNQLNVANQRIAMLESKLESIAESQLQSSTLPNVDTPAQTPAETEEMGSWQMGMPLHNGVAFKKCEQGREHSGLC
jgi:hypothetical protein